MYAQPLKHPRMPYMSQISPVLNNARPFINLLKPENKRRVSFKPNALNSSFEFKNSLKSTDLHSSPTLTNNSTFDSQYRRLAHIDSSQYKEYINGFLKNQKLFRCRTLPNNSS